MNFTYLRRLAINLFRTDSSRTLSVPNRRKLSAWDPDYWIYRKFDASALCAPPMAAKSAQSASRERRCPRSVTHTAARSAPIW